MDERLLCIANSGRNNDMDIRHPERCKGQRFF
jgi:hypothetical protein